MTEWPERGQYIAKVLTQSADGTTTATYKVVQANLQRKFLATRELVLEAKAGKYSMAMVQEPYIGAHNSMKGQAGMKILQNINPGEGVVKAAIMVFDGNMDIELHPTLTTNNIAVGILDTENWKMVLVSYYFEPNQPIEPYIQHLVKIRRDTAPLRMLIGGDANAKSVLWGSAFTDDRGEEYMCMLAELDMTVMNTGTVPTFDTVRGGVRLYSHVDVTACSDDLLRIVDRWHVDEALTGSDHNAIIFGLMLESPKGKQIQRTTRLYNTKKAKWADFNNVLKSKKEESGINTSTVKGLVTAEQIDSFIIKYTQIILETCEETIPRKKPSESLAPAWWSPELAKLKREFQIRHVICSKRL